MVSLILCARRVWDSSQFNVWEYSGFGEGGVDTKARRGKYQPAGGSERYDPTATKGVGDRR